MKTPTKITDCCFCLQDQGGKEYEFREVVQKPISPAYKEIIDKTKNMSLKHLRYLVKEEGKPEEE